MHKVNTRWGELAVRYARNDEGREWLRVPTGAEQQEWVLDKSRPPRTLAPRDLVITGDWDRHLTMALAADVEDDRASAAATAKNAAEQEAKFKAAAQRQPPQRKP